MTKMKCFPRVLGSKFGTGNLKVFKKTKKSLQKKIPILTLNDYCENEKVILLSFIFIILSIFSLVSLACIRSETTNLQHIFCVGRGVLPYVGYRYVLR